MTTMRERVAALTPAQREQLLQLAMPRLVTKYQVHVPHPKQQIFLSLSQQREVLYGGAAGGGKSDALLMSALQYADVPGYSALILRRTWPDLNAAGAILDRCRTWLKPTDAKEREGGRSWVFPSGARLSFGYLQHENDKYKFQSAEYQFIGFDELTQFPESQYTYLFSRLRRPQIPCLTCRKPVKKYYGGSSGIMSWKHTSSTNPCRNIFPDPAMVDQFAPAPDGTSLWDVPLRMRSATNPGGVGHAWVHNKFINKKSRNEASIFIPASLHDNPSLDQQSYEESLSHLTGVDRARLLSGDWSVFEGGGVFERSWFTITNDAPRTRNTQIVRAWDMASTENAGDYTVGTLVSLTDGKFYIEHQIRGQWTHGDLEKIIYQTAQQDGQTVAVRMEQEPGSAGKNIIASYRRLLAGYNFDGDRPTGSKPARAQPWAVAAENGNVALVAGQWNSRFLDEAEVFPNGANDDQIDSVSVGVAQLAFGRRSRLLV